MYFTQSKVCIQRSTKNYSAFLPAEKVYQTTCFEIREEKIWGKRVNKLFAVQELPDTLWGIEFLSPRSENYILCPYPSPQITCMHFAQCYSLVFDHIVRYYLLAGNVNHQQFWEVSPQLNQFLCPKSCFSSLNSFHVYSSRQISKAIRHFIKWPCLNRFLTWSLTVGMELELCSPYHMFDPR